MKEYFKMSTLFSNVNPNDSKINLWLMLLNQVLLPNMIFKIWMTKAYCVEDCDCSNTINIKEIEKINPKRKKMLHLQKVSTLSVVNLKIKFVLKQWQAVKILGKKRKCTHANCTLFSNSAWCETNSNGTNLKIVDMSHNSKCSCQNERRSLSDSLN